MSEEIELLVDNWDPDYGTGEPRIQTVRVCPMCTALVLDEHRHMESLHG